MVSRLLRVLGLALAAASALLVLAFAFLIVSFDPNDYRSLIESSVAQAIDREVRITGDVELALTLAPTLAVSGVTIANPTWASQPVMIAAERLEARIALKPLLERRIEIASIALEDVDALLERDAEGRGNWELDLFASSARGEASDTGFRASVASVELRNIAVRYSDAEGSDLMTRVDLVTFEHSVAGLVSIEAAGEFETIPIRIEWEAGPLSDRDDGSGLRWPVAMTAALGDTSVTMTGRLRAPMAYLDSDFELHIAGSNAGQFQDLFDLPRSEELVYDLAGRVRIDDASVRVDELQGRLSNGQVFKDLTVDSGHVALTRGRRVEVSLAGDASGQSFSIAGRLGLLLDLVERTRPWPIDIDASLGGSTLLASGTVTRSAAGMSASGNLDVSGTVSETLNRLRPWGLPELGPLRLHTALAIDPEHAALDDLLLELAGTELSGAIEISKLEAGPRVVARLSAPSIDLAAFPSAATPADAPPLFDRPLPLAWLALGDAAVELELGGIEGLPVSIENAAVSGELSAGVLQLEAVSARVLGVDVRGRGSVRLRDDAAEVAIELQTQQLDFARLHESLDSDSELPFTGSVENVSLSVQTTGSTIRSAAEAATALLVADAAELGFAVEGTDLHAALSRLQFRVEPSASTRLDAAGRLSARLAEATLDESFELVLIGESLPALLQPGGPGGPAVGFELASNYHGQPLQLAGRIDDSAALMRRAVTGIELGGSWGPLDGAVRGMLNPAAGLAGTTVDVDLSTTDVAEAARVLNFGRLPGGPGSLSGQVVIGEQSLALANSSLAAPEVAVDGSLSLSLADRPSVRGELHFSMLDLSPYLPEDEAASDPAAQADAEEAPFALHRIYSTMPFELEALRRADADLDLIVDLLRVRQLVSSDVELNLRLDDGQLTAGMTLDGGNVRADASIDARTDELEVAAHLAGNGIALAADRSGERAAGTPVVDLDATFVGRGASSQALAESLNGDVLLYLRGGRIRQSGFRFLFGSVFYQLLDAVNPFSKQRDYVDIDCAGAYFELTDGVLSTEKGIVLQTPELQAVGIGSANLVDGTLALRFRTKRRQGIVISIGGVVNEFVQLTGTLDRPRIEISAERAARSGLLALATAGLSIVANDFFGRVTAGDVCSELPVFIGAPE